MKPRLKVAVVHYHLKPGGVTRVVENCVAAFQEAGIAVDFAILVGPPGKNEFLEKVREIPELGYADENPELSPEDLLKKLQSTVEECFGGPPDLWHIHNHSLGKNTSLSGAVALLAEKGERILLQIHDFAEEGRPGNYHRLSKTTGLLSRLYPQAPHVAYAVLNRRDYQNLKSAGLAEDRLYTLPNAIQEPDPQAGKPIREWIPQAENFQDLILYPVRATRRKNFGELLLWSLAAKHRTGSLGLNRPLFVNTLGPTNPKFESTFQAWKDLATRLVLPVRFALAEEVDASFESVVASSRAILTTSVAEGFGLGFLEPWLFGKPLIGRNLPEITQDFVSEGIQLPALYSRLEIPLDWVGGVQEIRRRVEPALRKTLGAYGKKMDPGHIKEAMGAFVSKEKVDFGRLDEDLQKVVLEMLDSNPGLFASLEPEKPGALATEEVIQKNKKQIQARYSTRAYAENLHEIYQNLLQRKPGELHFLDPESVLDAFLDPRSFNLLRTT